MVGFFERSFGDPAERAHRVVNTSQQRISPRSLSWCRTTPFPYANPRLGVVIVVLCSRECPGNCFELATVASCFCKLAFVLSVI